MRRARARGRALLAMVVAITAITAGVVPIDARANRAWSVTRTEAYDMGAIGPMDGMWGCRPLGHDGALGTVCFGRTIGDSFRVTVRDDSGRKVGGLVQVQNRGGWTVLNHRFCGTSRALRSVPGELRVHLDAPGDVRGTHWWGGPGCAEIHPLDGSAGTADTRRAARLTATTQGATSGTVSVTFTGD